MFENRIVRKPNYLKIETKNFTCSQKTSAVKNSFAWLKIFQELKKKYKKFAGTSKADLFCAAVNFQKCSAENQQQQATFGLKTSTAICGKIKKAARQFSGMAHKKITLRRSTHGAGATGARRRIQRSAHSVAHSARRKLPNGAAQAHDFHGRWQAQTSGRRRRLRPLPRSQAASDNPHKTHTFCKIICGYFRKKNKKIAHRKKSARYSNSSFSKSLGRGV